MDAAAHRGFRRYATVIVVYLLFVILFGAWVRITHSGAGCGSHWPTCNGDIVPLQPSVETMIEYTHRVTSGLLGPAVLVLVGWAARTFGRSRVTVAAVLTMIFVVLEALIGAGLVLKELVADDDSAARAIVISLHLVNTLILTGSAALTAWWSYDDRTLRPAALGRGTWVLLAGLLALVVTSMTGAVTALGDTLFPVSPGADELLSHVREEMSSANHFLVRLRVVHPVVAVVAAGMLYGVGAWAREYTKDPLTPRLARGLQHAVVAQVVVGVVTIGLAAPGWMQLVHLLMAQMVWMAAVLTTVSAWAGAGRE
ncbi:MAG: COX15/CtaA family protein [Nannocystaceae bacterium]|nr:COX15/CtaA family protein [bacterium]